MVKKEVRMQVTVGNFSIIILGVVKIKERDVRMIERRWFSGEFCGIVNEKTRRKDI